MPRAKRSEFMSVRMTKSCARDLAFLARHFGRTKGNVIGELIEREASVVRTREELTK